ncbi:MAG: hypothetical protein CME65_02035 [Halobacteriovoraceae bacterium]|nr:hypothetical protein [Halobacteriovoraceae bacterium]
MINGFFSNSFSHCELAPRVKGILSEKEIAVYSDEWSDTFDRSLIFIREEGELPDFLSDKNLIIFKYPFENGSLFEVESKIEVFELTNDLEELEYFINHLAELLSKKSEIQKRKFFEQKENKELVNSQLNSLDISIPQIIDAISSGEKLKPTNNVDQPSLLFDFSLKLVEEFSHEIQTGDVHENELEAKLNEIDHGLLLKNMEGEYIWFNKAFRLYGLNPAELPSHSLKTRGEVKFNSLERDWQVQTKALSDGYDLVIVTEIETQQGVQNNEELGIISSSIAHELNNPLGGISAALDVLMLEDDLNEETMDSLSSMKETVYRCKGLVQTFLGFSKKEISEADKIDWDKVFEQAYDLLKFRMVESQLKLNFKRKKSGHFSIQANSSVLTMVFYLMFNEFLTLSSHMDLVESMESRQVDLEIVESNSEVLIHCVRGIESIKLPQEKLLKHLLQIYDMELVKVRNGFSIKLKA